MKVSIKKTGSSLFVTEVNNEGDQVMSHFSLNDPNVQLEIYEDRDPKTNLKSILFNVSRGSKVIRAKNNVNDKGVVTGTLVNAEGKAMSFSEINTIVTA